MQLPKLEDGKMLVVLHALHRAGVVNYLLLLMVAVLELIGFGLVLHAHFFGWLLDAPTKTKPNHRNRKH